MDKFKILQIGAIIICIVGLVIQVKYNDDQGFRIVLVGLLFSIIIHFAKSRKEKKVN